MHYDTQETMGSGLRALLHLYSHKEYTHHEYALICKLEMLRVLLTCRMFSDLFNGSQSNLFVPHKQCFPSWLSAQVLWFAVTKRTRM